MTIKGWPLLSWQVLKWKSYNMKGSGTFKGTCVLNNKKPSFEGFFNGKNLLFPDYIYQAALYLPFQTGGTDAFHQVSLEGKEDNKYRHQRKHRH